MTSLPFPVRVSGESMRPLLPPGARAIALPLSPPAAPRVGEVVVVRHVRGSQGELIKRILGQTAAGEYLLAADNPSRGAESVDFGPVPRAAIVARVPWRYWPLPPRRL
jgi:phage repressor protein C with HTH and peptisase S24 domain